MSKTQYTPAVYEYVMDAEIGSVWHCAVPEGFVFPEGFDPFKDQLPGLPEGAIDLEHAYEVSQRLLALMIALDEYDISGRWNAGSYVYDIGRREYIVATDDEADELWDSSLENYIGECILPGLPENYRSYFDRDAWKKDAKVDGRAHRLNSYDGNEESVDLVDHTSNGVKVSLTLYIYRTN